MSSKHRPPKAAVAKRAPHLQQDQATGRIERRLEMVAQHYKGPIPPPALLREFDEIRAGTSDWILDQATEQGQHRRKMEARIVNWGTFNEFFGIFAALTIALMAIGGGIYLISRDKDSAGLATVITALSALVVVFVVGKKRGS